MCSEDVYCIFGGSFSVPGFGAIRSSSEVLLFSIIIDIINII